MEKSQVRIIPDRAAVRAAEREAEAEQQQQQRLSKRLRTDGTESSAKQPVDLDLDAFDMDEDLFDLFVDNDDDAYYEESEQFSP